MKYNKELILTPEQVREILEETLEGKYVIPQIIQAYVLKYYTVEEDDE